MCGIAATFNSTAPAPKLDLEAILHRGPDGGGEWQSPDQSVWLGHRRLAILDPSESGAQPMIDPASGNVIVFNGEIYNHLDLREALKPFATEWRGTSDTETLLVAYRVWGESFLERLRGMFAFVIYDAQSRGLFVARDRLGIKPLYYRTTNGVIAFCSETRPLLALQQEMAQPAADSVSAFLQWGACPENALLFPGIKSLGAGQCLRVLADGRTSSETYWTPRPPRTPTRTAPDAVRECRRQVERAVREHLISDVPVAAFLSGGIDSSIVTGLSARELGRRLMTFSVGFRQQEFDETAIAKMAAERFNTDHHRIELEDEEVIEIVQLAVTKLDLPSYDAINTFIVCKKVAEQGLKVALSGLGGDELFGGYPSFRDVPKLQWLARIPRWLLNPCVGVTARSGRLRDLPRTTHPFRLAAWRRQLWTGPMLRHAGFVEPFSPREVLPELADSFAMTSWAELSRYMRHMLLRDSDQMSMAVSLELRVPFLDHELVEWALGVSGRIKRHFPGTKGLLIEAFKDLLPPEVYRRKKMGFGLPMEQWMRGPLAGFTQRGIEALGNHGLVKPEALDRIQEDFRERRIHWNRIWSLVVLGHYLDRVRTEGAGGVLEASFS